MAIELESDTPSNSINPESSINVGASRKLRILWLGHWHSDQALYGRKAVNQAATTWSRGLLLGLKAADCEIRVCTHCWEQYWPKGRLLPGVKSDFDHSFPVTFTKYLNIPGVRGGSLMQRYKRMVSKEITTFKPDVVLTYNLYPYHCGVADILVEAKCKWVPVVLDQDDPAEDNWQTFQQQSKGAAGLVFLSHWGTKNYPGDLRLLHLDGGISKINEIQSCDDKGKVLVYSGKYDSDYGGLDVLFEIFSKVKTRDCRFILTGKDPHSRAKKYLVNEPRAEYVGFLNREELHAVNLRATAFINPRPAYISDNRMTFPSKLLSYLAYGKPIISTWTDGLSPEYRELLWVADSKDGFVQQCATLVDQAFATSAEERKLLADKIASWIDSGHKWDQQAMRLVQFVSSLVH